MVSIDDYLTQLIYRTMDIGIYMVTDLPYMKAVGTHDFLNLVYITNYSPSKTVQMGYRSGLHLIQKSRYTLFTL